MRSNGRCGKTSTDDTSPPILPPEAAPGQARVDLDPATAELLGEAVRRHRSGELDMAIALYRRVVQQAPELAAIYCNFGVVLRARGHLDEAEAIYRRGLKVDPKAVDILFNLANLRRDRGALDEAILLYRSALRLKDNHSGALTNLGLSLRERGEFSAALETLEQALALAPNEAGTTFNRALVLYDLKLTEAAALACQRAIEIDADYAPAYDLLGQCLRSSGFLLDAEACHRKAIALKPGQGAIYAGLGQTLIAQGRFSEALNVFEESLRLDPNLLPAKLGRAYVQLAEGNWREGFVDYEERWRLRDFRPRPLAQPCWDGGDLGGRSILLHPEQGYGDTIAALRFIPAVKAKNATVILEIQPALRRLLDGFPGIDRMIVQGEGAPETAVHCPLMTLPGLLGVTPGTLPPAPYLKVPQGIDLGNLPDLLGRAERRFKVGIVWSGNPSFNANSQRSTSLEPFLGLAAEAGLQLYSLQKGEPAAELAEAGAQAPIIDLGPHLTDFAVTAAVLAKLDLVIMTDSAVAHLAGALGRPVWLLLHKAPYWFWGLSGQRTPWYPTLRLIRQPAPGDWGSVFDRVAWDLTAILRGMP